MTTEPPTAAPRTANPPTVDATVNPRTGFDLDEVARLLTTTKQVRKRLDLARPVPHSELLECIDLASHAPMGSNLERNRWLIVDDPDTKAAIANVYTRIAGPYLAANEAMGDLGDRQNRVIDSARYLLEHLAEVPTLVLSMRLDRPPLDQSQGQSAGYYGSVVPGIWSFQLAARARGIGSAWTTLHLEEEEEVAELLGIPPTVTQVCLLAVGYYTGDTFTPAPRRSAREITYLNRWKQLIE
jgi:nitroreductase